MFQPDLTEDEQDRMLADIAGWEGVQHAARLDPSATIEPVRRMFYVTAGPEIDSGLITGMVSALPAVESAAPAARRMAAGIGLEPVLPAASDGSVGPRTAESDE